MSMNKLPVLVGVTGGIGSGKSTVCKIFEMLGIPVYYADDRAKNITRTDKVLKEAIINRFGIASYEGDSLNSTFLAAKVFSNSSELQALNGLIHPRVAVDFENWVKNNSTSPYVLKEAALIFETKGHLKLDKVITVSATEETRINRVLKRDKHRTAADISKIIANQMPEQTKTDMADYIIKNDDETMLIPQVLRLHEQLVRIR